MKKCFKEKEDTQIVNDIFNATINNFPNKYHTIISYDNRSHYNDNNHYFYKKLFKQSDLVQYIFQHLELRYDKINSLINCSFVDSIWLLNSFNPKCYQYSGYWYSGFNIRALRHVNKMRVWQRFSCLKRLLIDSPKRPLVPEETHTLANGLKSIKIEQLERLQIGFNVQDYPSRSLLEVFVWQWMHQSYMRALVQPVIKRLMNNHSLKTFDCTISGITDIDTNTKFQDEEKEKGKKTKFVNLENKKLMINCTNCEHVFVSMRGSSQFMEKPMSLVVSKKCKLIKLDEDCILDIANSDLSGVEQLYLVNIKFTEAKSKNDIIQLSKQCTKIKLLEICGSTDDSMIFWQGINNYLIKNNTRVQCST